MKRNDIFHPVVFSDKEWAEGYYKRNYRNIKRVGKRLADLLKQQGFKGGKILDAGCGFASVPIEIAKMFPGSEIIGVDLGEPLLDIGNKLIKDNKLENNITLRKGDVMKINYDNNSFDLVINTFLLHIVDNPVLMLNEIERVAKADGNIIITDLRRGFLANLIKKFRTSYTIDEALQVIKKSDIRNGNTAKGTFWWDYTSFN